jgi:tRNA(Ile2) C34 agmatinyltransferase TiaS
MSTTIAMDLFRPSILDRVEEIDVPVVTAPRHGGGGLTLDDLVVGVWEDLAAHRTVACPGCGEAMTPRYGAGPAPVGGRCRSCGTTIQ